MNKIITTIEIELPQNLTPGETILDDGNLLQYSENATHRWGWVYVGEKKGTSYQFVLKGVPGNAPAAGNYSEWSIKDNAPFIGDTFFHVSGVTHANNSFMIIGSHSSTNDRRCAIGFSVPKE